MGPLFYPSGASRVTVSGSHRSKLTARMEAGVPGPSLVHVLGRAEVECDPEAGAATTLRECSGLRWAGQKIPDERHSEGEGSGWGAGEQPLQTVK